MRGELGSSAVIAVVSVPLLLVFLFAIVDLGRVVFLQAELDTAAHAVCRYAKACGNLSPAADELTSVALAASPSLEDAGIQLSVDVSSSGEEEGAYEHRVYDRARSTFEKLTVKTTTRRIEAVLEAKGSYLTPLGPALASETAGRGTGFSCRASAVSWADSTAKEELQ